MANLIDRLVSRYLTPQLEEATRAAAEGAVEKLYDNERLWLSGDEVPMPDIGGAGLGSSKGEYSSSWVAYSCIRRQALDASGVPLLFLRDPDDPESKIEGDHPIKRLFERPNPYFTRAEFIQWIVTALGIRGEFFVMFDDPYAPTVMMQYTEPRQWKETVKGGALLGWEYRNNNEHYLRLPHEIMHHKLIDPSNPFRGQPPIRAAAVANGIEVGSERLVKGKLDRGGERTVLMQQKGQMSRPQKAKLSAQLRSRRGRGGQPGQEIILPQSVEVLDPKFLEGDLAVLADQRFNADKVCAVFGMSKSLLGLEDIDKYATFQGRERIYWGQTLLPTLRGVQDTFDRQFAGELVRRQDKVYIRFDATKIEALQSDLAERFEMAGKAHKDGLPWSVCNERFNLGLDVDEIPAGDQVLVSSTLAPADKLVEQWEAPSGGGADDAGRGGDDKAEAKSSAGGSPSTSSKNLQIKRRATDPKRTIQRNIRLGRLERDARLAWRKAGLATRKRLAAALGEAGATEASVKAAIRSGLKGWAEASAKKLDPLWKRAAGEGMLAIQDLVEDKGVTGAEYSAFMKAPVLRDEMVAAIKKRRNRILAMQEALFDELVLLATAAVVDGEEMDAIINLVMGRMDVRISRAVTIARTEVGTAYSAARYAETKAQGFKQTMWLTAADELVRGEDPDDEFDHARCNEEVRAVGKTFPCGLEHPMEEGGEAGNVINCRCEAIPYEEA